MRVRLDVSEAHRAAHHDQPVNVLDVRHALAAIQMPMIEPQPTPARLLCDKPRSLIWNVLEDRPPLHVAARALGAAARGEAAAGGELEFIGPHEVILSAAQLHAASIAGCAAAKPACNPPRHRTCPRRTAHSGPCRPPWRHTGPGPRRATGR